MAAASKALLDKIFAGIDVDAACDVLDELGLPQDYSAEAVERVNAEADRLADEAAELKRSEAPKSERKAVRAQVDRLVNARAFLYRMRPSRPGDIGVEVAPVGKESN